jgi:hypothetical protein
MKIIDLWKNPECIGYYSIARIKWSPYKIWTPNTNFDIPDHYYDKSGLYMLIRDHRRQYEPNKIAYIGKTNHFGKRLTTRHHMHDILVARPGATKVSCGIVGFEWARNDTKNLLQIEDIIKFSIWEYLENTQGFCTLPGFRYRSIRPWIIGNSGWRGKIPRRIIYPAFAKE